MNPVAPSGEPNRARNIEKQWTVASMLRERRAFMMYSILGGLLVVVWSVFDRLVEPALFRPFLYIRAVDGAIGLLLLVGVVRARSMAGVRLFGSLRILVAGAAIGFMCSRVSTHHYFPYVLGFSLVFWYMGLVLTWPLRFSLALFAAVFAFAFLARQLGGTEHTIGDEAGALFYLGSTAFISIGMIENRRHLHYRTFLANYDLDERNRDLDETVRSLRLAQRRLVEGEKLTALGRLVASLSHEINNPVHLLKNNLDPLRGYLTRMTEVLEIGRDGADVKAAWQRNDLDFVVADAVEAMETMDLGIRRIQTVHNEMRAFVRGDAPDMTIGDLNEGLRATVNMFRRSLPPQISIEALFGALPATLFQPGQLNQVFFNVIQNAVDAIEEAGNAGAILVRTEEDGGWAQVVVEDSGPGVSPFAREHLFEPFFTTKGAGKGTGLGLATSYQIVQRHRGVIKLDPSCREGARFVLRLPAAGSTRS